VFLPLYAQKGELKQAQIKAIRMYPLFSKLDDLRQKLSRVFFQSWNNGHNPHFNTLYEKVRQGGVTLWWFCSCIRKLSVMGGAHAS
jgi:hypothetical protein